MKPSSLWIIRVALTVQFLGVIAVPAIVFASESPRALWMAEWLRPHSIERSIGILRLRDNKLSFTEQVGQSDWELDLSSIRRIATVNPSTSLRAGGGNALLVVTVSGDEYILSIMEANLTPASAKRARTTIENAIQLQAAISR
jgi:hypothetical protein